MFKIIQILLIVIPIYSSSNNYSVVNGSNNIDIKKDYTELYIEKYRIHAILSMHKYGIPASITLAQGILEGDSGRSKLAKEKFNHFGIKGSNGKYKRFDTDIESFNSHDRILNSSRYSDLKWSCNYKDWAYGLRDKGYCNKNKYPSQLIEIIKRYELYAYDIA